MTFYLVVAPWVIGFLLFTVVPDSLFVLHQFHGLDDAVVALIGSA